MVIPDMNGTLDGEHHHVFVTADGSSAGRLLIKGLGSSSGLNDFGGVPEFHPCCGPRCDDFTVVWQRTVLIDPLTKDATNRFYFSCVKR